MATADDAVLAKLATVKAGYYQDPYIEALSQHASGIAEGGRNRQRQVQPLIKRGTHARVCCVDRAIRAFVDYHSSSTEPNKNRPVQVVVLGSGKDTSFFRHGSPRVQWYEVDHASVLQTKASILQARPDIFRSQVKTTKYGYSIQLSPEQLNKSSGETAKKDSAPTIHDCQLIEHDLRDNPKKLLDTLLQQTTFDFKAPTLFLFECVLMYMPQEASVRLLQCLANSALLPQVYVCSYEPILGSDSFGKMMEHNLSKAGVCDADSCLRQTRSLEAQLGKLIGQASSDNGGGGFVRAVGCDMAQAYETIMTQVQRARANQCEFLDEIEEWMMIMRHYCFIVATAVPEGSDGDDFAKYFCNVGENSALGFVEGKCMVKFK